ncbi:hypothetical protein HDV63DRAFT_404353 [Trichoderma sp. SZMC 28014]
MWRVEPFGHLDALFTPICTSLQLYSFNISNLTPKHSLTMSAESCSKPSNFGRGAYDTTGLPKPPPPQPQ